MNGRSSAVLIVMVKYLPDPYTDRQLGGITAISGPGLQPEHLEAEPAAACVAS